MGYSETLHGQRQTQSPEDLASIRRTIELIRPAFDAASDALNMLATLEFEVLSHPCNLEENLDFYQLVRNFEINLIRRALQRANGKQRLAARLLNLNATTLNNKIKVYEIELNAVFLSIAPKPGNRTVKKTRSDLVA